MTARGVTVMVAVALLFGAACAAPPTTAPDGDAARPPVEMRIGGETFKLDLAVDRAARAKGLKGVKTLPRDRGMLFVFPRARLLRFWMDGCRIDLDLLYVDDRGRILDLHEMKAPPVRADEAPGADRAALPRYASRKPCRFAVELPAGSIRRLELRRGDTIEFDWPSVRRLAK